jgi:hypothetical protein
MSGERDPYRDALSMITGDSWADDMARASILAAERKFSPAAVSTYQITGPFETHWVLLEGRRVPFLQAAQADGGIIRLTLDERYDLDVAVADADRIIPFIADCIAVAMGYTCHPRASGEPVRSNPFPPCHRIDTMTTDMPRDKDTSGEKTTP